MKHLMVLVSKEMGDSQYFIKEEKDLLKLSVKSKMNIY